MSRGQLPRGFAMSSSARGWDEESDALARRALERAREAALARGLYPTRRPREEWEMATYGGSTQNGIGAGGHDAAGGGTAAGKPPAGQEVNPNIGSAADEPPEPGVSPSGWRAGPGLGAVGSGPGPSRRDPQGLATVARRILKQHGWSGPLAVASVVGRWAEVVGPDIAEHCHVESFTDGDLVVRADSTAWATQLRLLMPQIERRLEEEAGEGAVTSIEVRGPGGPSWKHGKWSVTGGRGPRDTYG